MYIYITILTFFVGWNINRVGWKLYPKRNQKPRPISIPDIVNETPRISIRELKEKSRYKRPQFTGRYRSSSS